MFFPSFSRRLQITTRFAATAAASRLQPLRQVWVCRPFISSLVSTPKRHVARFIRRYVLIPCTIFHIITVWFNHTGFFYSNGFSFNFIVLFLLYSSFFPSASADARKVFPTPFSPFSPFSSSSAYSGSTFVVVVQLLPFLFLCRKIRALH